MEINYVHNSDVYKILLVIEATNNGITSSVVEYSNKSEADRTVQVVNNGEGTGVEGQLVRAVPLY